MAPDQDGEGGPGAGADEAAWQPAVTLGAGGLDHRQATIADPMAAVQARPVEAKVARTGAGID